MWRTSTTTPLQASLISRSRVAVAARVINAVTTVPLPSSNIAGAYRVSFAVATDIESERSESDPDRVEIALTYPAATPLSARYNCPVNRPCDPDDPVAGFSPTAVNQELGSQ